MGEHQQFPHGYLPDGLPDDVPDAEGTTLGRGEGRVVVYATRPVIDPRNLERERGDRELEIVAAFALPQESFFEGFAAAIDRMRQSASRGGGWEQLCPCGSGDPFRECHGGRGPRPGGTS